MWHLDPELVICWPRVMEDIHFPSGKIEIKFSSPSEENFSNSVNTSRITTESFSFLYPSRTWYKVGAHKIFLICKNHENMA